MSVDGDMQPAKVSDQTSASQLQGSESEPVAPNQPVNLDNPAATDAKYADHVVPHSPQESPDSGTPPTPTEALQNLLASMPNPPTLPDNPTPQQLEEFQKKMSDYTNMMDLLSNILRMMEEIQKNIMSQVR